MPAPSRRRRSVRQTGPITSLPGWIAPQLSQFAEAVPDGDQWAHEIKLDGYRMHARLEGGRVKLLTRTGLDWTEKYPSTAKALGAIDVREA
jgi:bifunctional non-homologous end joining protein LigD